MNLYRQINRANYPYTIPDLISITGSSEDENHYFYFYDWEVYEQCASEAVPVTVMVGPLAPPSVSDITRCGSGPVSLTASHPNGRINWYDTNGNLLHTGNTYTTPSLSASRSYEAEAVLGDPEASVGPATPQAVGTGEYLSVGTETGLYFDVYKSLELKTVYVDAEATGTRDIVIRDERNRLIQTFSVNIPRGRRRLRLNVDLEPGRYFIGGTTMEMYHNTDGASFPYTEPGLLSITGSNDPNRDVYYYFYDWEVQEIPCISARVPVQAIWQRPKCPV
jgi:hypothetical protein